MLPNFFPKFSSFKNKSGIFIIWPYVWRKIIISEILKFFFFFRIFPKGTKFGAPFFRTIKKYPNITQFVGIIRGIWNKVLIKTRKVKIAQQKSPFCFVLPLFNFNKIFTFSLLVWMFLLVYTDGEPHIKPKNLVGVDSVFKLQRKIIPCFKSKKSQNENFSLSSYFQFNYAISYMILLRLQRRKYTPMNYVSFWLILLVYQLVLKSLGLLKI